MIKKLWPAIVWALFILVLTGVPGGYIPKVTRFLDWASPDKIVHFILFGVQTYLIFNAFKEQYIKGNHRLLFAIIAIGIGVLYGLITEVLQNLVFIGRDGNYFDFLADSIGAFIGFLAFNLQYRKKIAANKVDNN